MMQDFYIRIVHGSFFWDRPDPPQIRPEKNENIDPDWIFCLSNFWFTIKRHRIGFGGRGSALNIVTCAYQFWADLHLRFLKQNFFNGLYLYLYKILIHIEILFFASDFFLLTIIRHQMELRGCNLHSCMGLPILGRFVPTIF